ncbi:hypothetical protein EVB79_075 [Rhizobium phage RHph_N3_13]|nr:hypothetical protein EVB79_075 [Rhizobium phage RHph_N3_13]QIG69901.1 hypothetical protein F67_I3_11_075 [Rhizobium phage RHph_I3_11]QIG73071.1 hypothetical protein EVB99_080 [Rhizobium phage RHph_N3_19]
MKQKSNEKPSSEWYGSDEEDYDSFLKWVEELLIEDKIILDRLKELGD